MVYLRRRWKPGGSGGGGSDTGLGSRWNRNTPPTTPRQGNAGGTGNCSDPRLWWWWRWSTVLVQEQSPSAPLVQVELEQCQVIRKFSNISRWWRWWQLVELRNVETGGAGGGGAGGMVGWWNAGTDNTGGGGGVVDGSVLMKAGGAGGPGVVYRKRIKQSKWCVVNAKSI